MIGESVPPRCRQDTQLARLSALISGDPPMQRYQSMMRVGRIIHLVTGVLLPLMLLISSTGSALAQRAYREVVPAGTKTDHGLFDVHHVGDRLLFVVQRHLLCSKTE